MLPEADLIAKRAALRWLVERHPQWTQQELAAALRMSRSWVSKWLQRLRQADPHDVMALHSRSRARHTPPASIASQPAVVQRILEIRAAPPENLQRVPGPEAILYYVHRDPTLKDARVRLPRSQTTIWKILRSAGCIQQDRRRKPKSLSPRQPGEEVQFDLKDASSVPADPAGKRQHVVEIANFVDAGTSIWLHRQVGADFDAETLLEVVAQFFREHGLPARFTFDNDPRFVGSASGRDFPSALVRFLWCVGVTPNVIPPHRPDKNAYVERFHRSLGQECLQVHRPGTLSQVVSLTEAFLTHYNSERPNQARSCGNQPPGLLCEPESGRSAGHVLGQRSREVLRYLATGRTYQVDPDQRLAWKADALPGVCGADEARGALGISAVSAYPSQVHPGPAVGLSLPSVQREGIKRLHQECPTREDASRCLLRSWVACSTCGAGPASRRRPALGSLYIPLVSDR